MPLGKFIMERDEAAACIPTRYARIRQFRSQTKPLNQEDSCLTYMNVVMDGILELQDGQIVLEGRCIVLPVHDDTFHVLRDGALRFQVTRDVELAKHCYERGKEAV